MNKIFLNVFLSILLIVSYSCTKESNPEPQNSNLDIKIEGITANQDVFVNEKYTLTSKISGDISKVEYFLNGSLLGSSITEPYSITWEPKDLVANEYDLIAIGYTSDKNEARNSLKVNLKLRLGDLYQGGRIYFINPNGKSGLIAAISDLKVGSQETFMWGQSGVLLGTTKDNGKENTKIIAQNSPINSVANTYMGFHFKGGFNLNGYDDWYIPSITESELLVAHKQFVSNFPTNSNNARYWTSSEISDTIGYPINWIALMGNSVHKSYMYKIRPVRQF